MLKSIAIVTFIIAGILYNNNVWAKDCPSGQVGNGKTCDVCYDSVAGAKTDAGCGSGKWAGKPICAARGYENKGQKRTGDHCVVCINDKKGKEIDSGCKANAPFCRADEGKFGNTCSVCSDTADGVKTDAGCNSGKWAGKHVCVTDASGKYGERCINGCINDKTGNKKDTGCTSTTPICDAAQGKYGNACISKITPKAALTPKAILLTDKVSPEEDVYLWAE